MTVLDLDRESPVHIQVGGHELKLLVEWSSPWEEFRTAIGPAFAKSGRKLAGEARTSIFPYRGILLTWVAELLVLAAIIIIPAKLASMRPFEPPPQRKYEVLYYSGDELPRIEDSGGAQTGRSGKAGGREAFHRTQTIRVMRGGSLREKIVDAPNIKLPVSDTAVANLLAYKPIPGPPPAEGLKSSLRSSTAPETQVVAPAPSVERQNMLNAPSLNQMVVAPSPSAPKRDLTALQLPGSRVVPIVPPPVSAPERASMNLNPKLTLPSQTVVAPAPAPQIARDLSQRGPGFGSGELRKQVVPPAVQLPSGTARRGTGLLNGESDVVVAPTVQMSSGAVEARRAPQGLNGSVGVVAPPVQMANSHLRRPGVAGLEGTAKVAAPTPSLSGVGSLTGRGQGTRGGGLGGAFDSGDVAAPPKAGGSGNGTGVVVSSNPGTQKGIPSSGGAGTLAMSPTGGKEPGLGGAGGGTSIGHGNGPGSGFSGEGSGAGKEGAGRGSDPTAKGGISPYPGSGGAGTGVNGAPSMPGVSVKGGNNNVVNLPSFGSNGDQPTDLSRSSVGKDRAGSGITVVATSRSGGAFNFYGYLKGDKVYTIYLDTMAGPAVMQMADPLSVTRPGMQELEAPQPIRTDVPAGVLHTHLVVACVMDATGQLKNFQVLEPGNATMMAKVMAALPHWKFRPATREGKPVEVTAILGFNVDTSDRY